MCASLHVSDDELDAVVLRSRTESFSQFAKRVQDKIVKCKENLNRTQRLYLELLKYL